MRLCSIHGNAEAVAGESVGRSRAAADKGGTRGENTGFDAVCTAGAKFNDLAARGGRGHTRGLAGDKRLEMKYGEEAGLDELGFGDRSRDTKQGFAGKEDRALGDGPNVAPEAELREIVEEVRTDMAEHRQSADISDFFAREADIFEEVQSLFEACGDEIVAMAR